MVDRKKSRLLIGGASLWVHRELRAGTGGTTLRDPGTKRNTREAGRGGDLSGAKWVISSHERIARPTDGPPVRRGLDGRRMPDGSTGNNAGIRTRAGGDRGGCRGD